MYVHRTRHARVQPKINTTPNHIGQADVENKSKTTHSTHTHAQNTHTHLHIQEWAFILKVCVCVWSKRLPLNALRSCSCCHKECKDTQPPPGQASSCHVQQMQPKLSKKNHNSKVRKETMAFEPFYWKSTRHVAQQREASQR